MAKSMAPRVALVTDCDLNRHILQSVLIEAGYELVLSLDTDKLNSHVGEENTVLLQAGLDAWLVDLNGENIQRSLDILVENSDLPLLVNDEIPPTTEPRAHSVWHRRLLEKLEVVAIRSAEGKAVAASNIDNAAWNGKVWVLAASLGGPEAIKSFLQALPSRLPIAMVYGQHIETNFDGLLADAMGSEQGYPLQLVRGEHQLKLGDVAVVPVDHQLRFLTRGRIVETRKSWVGSFQPALDQVIAELARVYRHNLGVIIFSGTCNDGAVGCRVAKACGATIWAQAPDSCLSPAMPNAAIATGCVTYQGTPEQLAESLAHKLTTDRDVRGHSSFTEKTIRQIG